MRNEWRQAQIIAIYNEGSGKLACNYRPVSLTGITHTIMELVVKDRSIAHTKRNNLLGNRQY